MSAVTPGLRTGLSQDQLATLVSAVRDAHLSPAQSELLARLVLEIGTAILVWPRIAHRCPPGQGCVAAAWGLAAEAFSALVTEIPP